MGSQLQGAMGRDGKPTQVTQAIESPLAVNRRSAVEACLVVLQGAEMGRQFRLGDETWIGRSHEAEIRLDDSATSRRHARIERLGDAFQVVDNGSTNGTWVNDERIGRPALLEKGAILHVGRTTFKFLTGDDVENAYHSEIYKLTTTDPLTGIFNKRYLLDELGRETARVIRYGRPMAVLVIDLDKFKLVNDTHGHQVGDVVLQILAQRVRGQLRRSDFLARFGGEEFVIVAVETDAEAAMHLAEKVRRHVGESPFKVEGLELDVTLSIGVADTHEALDWIRERNLALEPEALRDVVLRIADERLYAAKSAGRNRSVGPPAAT